MDVAYSVGDHYHFMVRGVRHCGVVTEVVNNDGFNFEYTAQGCHPDNRDCEWAVEADMHRMALAKEWIDGL